LRHTVSSAFSKSTKAQNDFFFLFFKIKKKRMNYKSVVEYPDRNPHWFSLINKISSENSDSLAFKTAVNSLP
jgi:hypothetical protein